MGQFVNFLYGNCSNKMVDRVRVTIQPIPLVVFIWNENSLASKFKIRSKFFSQLFVLDCTMQKHSVKFCNVSLSSFITTKQNKPSNLSDNVFMNAVRQIKLRVKEMHFKSSPEWVFFPSVKEAKRIDIHQVFPKTAKMNLKSWHAIMSSSLKHNSII